MSESFWHALFNISLKTSKRISKTALRLSCLARLMEETLCFILMKSVRIWKADRDLVFYLILCFIFDHGLSVAGKGHLSDIHVERALIWSIRHRSLIRLLCVRKEIKNGFVIEDVTLTWQVTWVTSKCSIHQSSLPNNSILSSTHLPVSKVKRSGANGGVISVGNPDWEEKVKH